MTLCPLLFLPAVSNIWLCGTLYMRDQVSLAFIRLEFLQYGFSPRLRTKSKCLEILAWPHYSVDLCLVPT